MFPGGVAQLGEQLLCTQQVVGSIPIASTIFFTTFSRHSSAVELLVYTQTVVGSNPSASTIFLPRTKRLESQVFHAWIDGVQDPMAGLHSCLRSSDG